MDEMGSENGDYGGRTLHAVMVPFPAQGHITPCLQLAKKLVTLHGFRITFVNTTHIHERFLKSRSTAASKPDHEGIEFVTVSDGLPEDHPRLRDFTTFCNATLAMGPAFEELFIKLLSKSSITCVIRDTVFAAVHHVAKNLNIPVVVLKTSSAIASQCCYNLQMFIDMEILPIPAPPNCTSTPSVDPLTLTLSPPQSDAEAAARAAPLTCLPGGSPTMRVGDIPTFFLTHDLENFFVIFFLKHQNPFLLESQCILFNTFSDLEADVINAAKGFKSRPAKEGDVHGDSDGGDGCCHLMNENVFAIGPLVLDVVTDVDGVNEVALTGVGSGLWREDPATLAWLDGQEYRSVLFVSFGSITTVSAEQMREFASGLETSGVAFLWVIRPDLTQEAAENDEHRLFVSEFVKRTQRRALLVPWAPQVAVLAHPAVGAFLTHCGWNSTIESIASGVPMLVWPRFSDQNTNCRYVTSVWRIGLELQQSLQAGDGTAVVRKEEIAVKVRQIMSDDERDVEVVDIRRNCKNWQVAARKAVSRGGSSEVALAQFVELITGRKTKVTPSPDSQTP